MSDNGPGIAAEHRENVFRAYVTLNEVGSGLDLAVVRQIVLQHHWEIECRPSAEGGAEFLITGIRQTDAAHSGTAPGGSPVQTTTTHGDHTHR